MTSRNKLALIPQKTQTQLLQTRKVAMTATQLLLQLLQKLKDLQLKTTHQVARKLDIREKVLTPTEDQETSTTHQARFLEASLTSHTMTASTVIPAKCTLWSKSTRLNSASITLKMKNAHSTNSASSLTEVRNSDKPMTHFHKTSVKLLSVPFTPTTRLNHASTWRKELNAHSVKVAHSSMMTKKRETWSTHFQIFQKVWLSHQCQKRSETKAKVVDTTILTLVTKTTTGTVTKTTKTVLLWAHSSSHHWTNNSHHHPWSRSPASLKWLLLVDSTQTSIWAQPQWTSNLRFNKSSLEINPRCSLHHKCKTWCQWWTTNPKCKVKENNTGTTTTDLQRARTPSTDTRRRTMQPRSLVKKERRTLSRKNILQSRKRTLQPQKLKLLNNQHQ